MAHDGRQDAKMDPKLDTYRDKSIGMMSKSKSMWKGFLGCISVAKDRIELTSVEMPPVQSALRRAWPRAREFYNWRSIR